MKNILLATDLAVNSDRAMERALKLAKEAGAKLHIVHVLPAYKKKLTSLLKKDTADLIKGCIYDYKDSEKLDIEINIPHGCEICAEILCYAKNIKADVMVLGAHGRMSIMPGLLGSVVADILANPPCDILVARG